MTEKKEIDHCPGVQREDARLPLLIQEPQCASHPFPSAIHSTSFTHEAAVFVL